MTPIAKPGDATPLLPLVLGAVSVLVLVVLGSVLGRGGGDVFELGAIPAPAVDGTSIATDATGVPAPRALAATLFDARQATVPVPDRATMIVFLAHWCQHCDADVPVVVDWLASDPLPEGVEVRAVVTAVDPARDRFPPDVWLRAQGWEVPTLVDVDDSIRTAYGVRSFPRWVFVDADGVVVGSVGRVTATDLTAIAEQLAGG